MDWGSSAQETGDLTLVRRDWVECRLPPSPSLVEMTGLHRRGELPFGEAFSGPLPGCGMSNRREGPE